MKGKMLIAGTAIAAMMLSAGVSAADAEVVLQIGFENSISEPIGQALEKWQQLVEEQGDGSLKIELFPDSQLGAKNELIDGMTLGEPYITLADGAFYADYGVADFGIVFGPFLFDDWDQCWTLIESDWYAEQCAELETKGLKIVTSNWKYGERHTLTTKQVTTVDDLAGLKIRVPSNQIQSIGFDVLGATSTGMALDEVYQALQTGTIDGAENPLATLYGRKLHEVAKYLILDGHVKNFTTWVMSADLFNSLTPEQQELLVSTGEEAGLYNNELVDASEEEYLQMMIDEGVTVTELTDETLAGFKEKAQAFYEQGSTFGWSDGLYDTVRKAMGAE
ncbi:TRAP transporter solute receptor, DctP family [Marvinbryantia formatexigens DSM 14469]|uniref:TRAP transporter solute receptor, DctP family n=1 Tax=Marvinbryantia formatexigens DSM 14469 TaxID=478749 RepID=C6LKQ6_9FIRM|nr:C4-dicarboxylate TRAP transporter substrate-binding protein [Marvinbryantia formatexigens]EET58793.1 TRAP transporter solute receptor, DctP family [Marvinbryantia formatexigens DSM 14469]UWO24134.1 C4-dicarboxylate TRAP transporter substrate-binding protein [Marvinbryantia formatexigens DSM 14469]SDG69948.1 tripartite ATP-independent transporter solute receptor, DctP family [Marvinbryantia formatexigens]